MSKSTLIVKLSESHLYQNNESNDFIAVPTT